MLVGIILGVLAPSFSVALKPLSILFLRMIKLLIVPLIFSTLVVGIAGHGDDLALIGRLAIKSLIYFEVVTTVALFLGLAAVNIAKPGVGLSNAKATKPQLSNATLSLEGGKSESLSLLMVGSFVSHCP